MTGPPRIPLPTGGELDDKQRAIFDAVVSGPRGELVGPLRAAIHNADLAEQWQKIGLILRFETVFPPIASELAILLTARRWNSELEWVIHAKAARQAKLPESIINDIKNGELPTFEEQSLKEIYFYISELLNCGHVSAHAHAAIVARWGAKGVVELTAITGYYVMVALTLNAHCVPLPEDRKPELFLNGGKPPMKLFDLPLGPMETEHLRAATAKLGK
jgi:4-carboxymuconolactone decarboxylase